MAFDTKIKIVLRDNLAPWQEANVCAFLASGIAAIPGVVGEPYEDASGVRYQPMCRQPMLIHSATGTQLSELLQKAIARGDMEVAIYTEELFATLNDEDNRAEVARHATEELNLVGVAIRGKKNPVDRMTKHLPMHS